MRLELCKPFFREVNLVWYRLNRHKLQHMSIAKVEIFGLGGLEALIERNEHRKMLKQLRDKAKTVDKGALLDNEFDKEFLLGNTFSHKQQTKDRQDVG